MATEGVVESRIEVEVEVAVEVRPMGYFIVVEWMGREQLLAPSHQQWDFSTSVASKDRVAGARRARPKVLMLEAGRRRGTEYASCRVVGHCGVAGGKLQRCCQDGDKTARWGGGMEQIWKLSGEVLRRTS